MRIENEFTVKAPLERVWSYLLDVEKVAPCLPGAELTEVVDERTWKGKTNVKVGPVSLSFAGTVVMQERDDQAHRVVLRAEGREQRGKGAATAVATSRCEAVEGGTRVVIEADLTITGPVAQYGRGMIQDISERLTREFAGCLEANIGAAEVAPTPAEGAPAGEGVHAAATAGPGESAAGTEPAERAAGLEAAQPTAGPRPVQPVAAKPVKGLSLGLWALWRAVVRAFRRLVGSGGS